MGRHIPHIAGVGESLVPRVASGVIPEPSILLPNVPVITITTSTPLLDATEAASEENSTINRPNIAAEAPSTSISEQPGQLMFPGTNSQMGSP